MNEIKKVIDTLDDAVEKFDGVVDKAQTKMYKELVALIKDLELDSAGKVKQTIANLKVLTSIKSKLGKIANSDEWVAGVENLIRYFGKLQNEQNAYFSANFPEATLGEQAKKRHEAMKQIAVQNTVNALTDDGLKAGVTDKINDILLRAVTSGEKFGNLQEELRAYLVGKDGGTGALSRYATTYATTSISQFTGQNNKLLTQDLGVEWFMYTGSTKETTREFCTHLVEKRYIHRSEFRKILLGEIDGHQCVIYPKTGLPYGMIEGTNEDNFQINCGGWNCRHQLVPVSEFAVPQNIRDAFERSRQEMIDVVIPKEQGVNGLDVDIERPEDFTSDKLLALWRYIGKDLSNVNTAPDFRDFLMDVLGQAGSTLTKEQRLERQSRNYERMKKLPTYEIFMDLTRKLDTLYHTKKEDVSPAYREEYNKAITRLQDTIITKGMLRAAQDIRLCDNIRMLSKNPDVLRFGVDKVSPKTPNKLIVELKKRGFDVFKTIPGRALFDQTDGFYYFSTVKPPTATEEKDAGDAWCSYTYNYICVKLNLDRYNDAGSVNLVISHEFGHAFDAMKVRHERVWTELYDKWVDKIPNRYAEIQVFKWDMARKDKDFITPKKDQELIYATIDTLQCLMSTHKPIYNYKGHDEDYMKHKTNRIAELIAHASECYYSGNSCLQFGFTRLYNDLIAAYKASML